MRLRRGLSSLLSFFVFACSGSAPTVPAVPAADSGDTPATPGDARTDGPDASSDDAAHEADDAGKLPTADAGPAALLDASVAVDAAAAPDAGTIGGQDSGPFLDASSDAGPSAPVDSGMIGLPYATVTVTSTTLGSDPADLYVADAPNGTRLPLALMLQGAKVGREHMRSFAIEVAKWGFIVVVPDHRRFFFGTTDFFPEQQQVMAASSWLKSETQRATPIGIRLDATKLVLLGHSFGGVTGLNAIQGGCSFPLCVGAYTRPAELLGGVFFGTNTKAPAGGGVTDVDAGNLAVGFVQGLNDGKALPADGRATYDVTKAGRKAFVTIAGVNHYGITAANPPQGADRDPVTPTVSQTTAQRLTGRVSGLLLRWVTLRDEAARAALLAESANGVTVKTEE